MLPKAVFSNQTVAGDMLLSCSHNVERLEGSDEDNLLLSFKFKISAESREYLFRLSGQSLERVRFLRCAFQIVAVNSYPVRFNKNVRRVPGSISILRLRGNSAPTLSELFLVPQVASDDRSCPLILNFFELLATIAQGTFNPHVANLRA